MKAMKIPIGGAVLLLTVLAGCSVDWDQQSAGTPIGTGATSAAQGDLNLQASRIAAARSATAPAFANLPDRGDLLAYDSVRTARKSGAYAWHPIALSEEHAFRAAVPGGELRFTAPDGTHVRLRYERHIQHPDGNWTWVGRDETGQDAVITFGERAVFGVLPGAAHGVLRLTTHSGRPWLMTADPRHVEDPPSRDNDYLIPPALAAAAASKQSTSADTSSAEASSSATSSSATTVVDVIIGYSDGFAAAKGGTSQAITRLNNLAEITNQGYVNSQLDARIRLVHSLAVNYPDATDSGEALEKLTGYKSGTGPIQVDPAFQPLRDARETYGGDLVAFVRQFRAPENNGCGIAWLVGGGQSSISAHHAPFGYSVTSDGADVHEGDGKTYFCREETFAHELGHNMGQAHNLEDSSTSGAHSYSYGYRQTVNSGFYTVMAYRIKDSSQYAIRHFSNPIVLYNGAPTGTATADNARSMAQTMPIIAAFRGTVVFFSDVVPWHWAYDATKRIYLAGVATGCGTNDPYAPLYCPDDLVSRDQMAVYLVRVLRGASYAVPAATGTFNDVSTGYWAAPWIEQLARDGVTKGCSTTPLLYCPHHYVTRAEMAVFLLRTKYGALYSPPAPSGIFQDVPTSHWAAAWIEKLASDGITQGCSASPALFCPETTVSRDQMAVFLVRAINL